MNTYKITFTRENGTEGSDNFTAPNERQARKDFHEVYRHGNGSITSVELIRENDAPATKQQERDALKKIRAIVESLGPDSYIATAFEGCFEDAEQNIENDFALSMKDRWLSADRKLNAANGTIEDLRDKLSESEKDYEAAHAAAHEIADEKDAEIAQLKEEIEALKKRLLTTDELEGISALIANSRVEADTDAKDAAAAIVEHADNPSSTEFQQAVRKHRDADKRSRQIKAIHERILRVYNDTTAGA